MPTRFELRASPVSLCEGDCRLGGGVRFVRCARLAGNASFFGGLSSLAHLGGDGLLAVSDRGWAVRLPDWLPPVFPDGVEVLLSIDRSHPWMRLAMLRRWPSIDVERVSSRSERHDLIRAFLDAAGKDLSDADSERLLSHPMSCNPLFLRLLVDELGELT